MNALLTVALVCGIVSLAMNVVSIVWLRSLLADGRGAHRSDGTPVALAPGGATGSRLVTHPF